MQYQVRDQRDEPVREEHFDSRGEAYDYIIEHCADTLAGFSIEPVESVIVTPPENQEAKR